MFNTYYYFDGKFIRYADPYIRLRLVTGGLRSLYRSN